MRYQAKQAQRTDEIELEQKLGRDLTDKEKDNTEEAELALIAERVKAQKEQLKKEGRSNKRVSKAKEDDASKK